MSNISFDGIPFYEALSEQHKSVFQNAVQIRPLAAGQSLSSQAARADAIHILLEGYVSRATWFRDGQRQITGLAVRGDICDLHECFTTKSPHTIEAVTSGSVARIPRAVLLEWLQTRPTIAMVIWRSAFEREAILEQWALNLGVRTASARIAHLLCELLHRLQAVGFGKNDCFEFPLTQHALGEMVGLSTVHINRTLQSLRSDGLCSWSRRQVRINDVARLSQVAGFTPHYLTSWSEPAEWSDAVPTPATVLMLADVAAHG